MKPLEIPFANPQAILPGADFGDAYRMIVAGRKLDPMEAARRAIYRSPFWINHLLWLRNMLVKPFGLKPGAVPDISSKNSIGMFPVIESKPDRLVLGLNDKHLDFRLLVDVSDIEGNKQSVTVSTVVKTHNLLGRIYLAFVKPFHRVIVPTMLKRAALD